jgi:hypothetical protein
MGSSRGGGDTGKADDEETFIVGFVKSRRRKVVELKREISVWENVPRLCALVSLQEVQM